MKKIYCLLLLFFLCFNLDLWALDKPGSELSLVTPRDKLGQTIDLKLEFTNSEGIKQPLAKYFEPNKPVILVPGYLTCPRVCGTVFQGVAALINKVKLNFGSDYKVLVVSFDHEDTAGRAAEKKVEFFKQLELENPPEAAWQFLVGDRAQISSLMSQLGFKYLKDGEEFAHAAALYVLTPEGKLSQYFSDVSFHSFDVKLALLEAAKGEIGTLIDQALIFCFRFDPTKGKYIWVVNGALKIGGALTMVFLFGLLFSLWRREFSKKE